MDFLNFKAVLTSHERSKFICFMAALFGVVYHICVLIVFAVLKVRFMAFYNIFSVTLFTILTILVPRLKQYIAAYLLGSFEVIAHQILANYFLGSLASFHFFILLFALLPYILFEDKRKINFPFSAYNTIVFVVLEVFKFPGIAQIENLALIQVIFRAVNVSLATIVIVAITFVYSTLTHRTEKLLNEHNVKLNSEINLAARIQQSFLPKNSLEDSDWELSFYNKPMAGVSEDTYDIFNENQKLQGFHLSDVSGHGISSGMITMVVNTTIRKEFYRSLEADMEEVANRTNTKFILEKGEVNNYLTGIIVRVEENGHIAFVNAGHPSPILYRKESNTYEIIKRREDSYGPIGIKDLPVVFKSQTADMKSGDELILYTDGISEAHNTDKVQYKTDRLAKTISKSASLALKDQIQFVLLDLQNFTTDVEQEDDITIFILRKK